MTDLTRPVREHWPAIAGTYILGGVLKFTLFSGVALFVGFDVFRSFGWLTVFIAGEAVISPVYPGIRYAIPGYGLAIATALAYRNRRRGDPNGIPAVLAAITVLWTVVHWATGPFLAFGVTAPVGYILGWWAAGYNRRHRFRAWGGDSGGV